MVDYSASSGASRPSAGVITVGVLIAKPNFENIFRHPVEVANVKVLDALNAVTTVSRKNLMEIFSFGLANRL